MGQSNLYNNIKYDLKNVQRVYYSNLFYMLPYKKMAPTFIDAGWILSK